MKYYEQLKSIVGTENIHLSEIERMTQYVHSIPLDSFYEPVSIIDIKGKKRKLINLTSEVVQAWVRHACSSSRVRMQNFEHGALSELTEGRLLNSMCLIRGHLEAGGIACLCHNEIRKWTETGDSSIVEELIPKTFLGTSLVRAQKKHKPLEGLLLPSEQDKVPVGQIISAIDDFISLETPSGRAHSLYGFLCEYTHPNLRALRDYIDTEDHEQEGWVHQYRTDAKLTEKHYLMALDSLMSSMKAGHAACEMLRYITFGYDGTNAYMNFPNESKVQEIWETFLKWPEGLDQYKV